MQVLFVYKFLNIMPREKIKHKYRCSEPACGNIVRADKWSIHCRQKHGFKYARYFVLLEPYFDFHRQAAFSWVRVKCGGGGAGYRTLLGWVIHRLRNIINKIMLPLPNSV